MLSIQYRRKYYQTTQCSYYQFNEEQILQEIAIDGTVTQVGAEVSGKFMRAFIFKRTIWMWLWLHNTEKQYILIIMIKFA